MKQIFGTINIYKLINFLITKIYIFFEGAGEVCTPTNYELIKVKDSADTRNKNKQGLTHDPLRKQKNVRKKIKDNTTKGLAISWQSIAQSGE